MQIPAFWPAKVQNTKHFHSKLYYMYPAWGNTKNKTTSIPGRITMGHGREGPENGMSWQKRDGWQPLMVVTTIHTWSSVRSVLAESDVDPLCSLSSCLLPSCCSLNYQPSSPSVPTTSQTSNQLFSHTSNQISCLHGT